MYKFICLKLLLLNEFIIMSLIEEFQLKICAKFGI